MSRQLRHADNLTCTWALLIRQSSPKTIIIAYHVFYPSTHFAHPPTAPFGATRLPLRKKRELQRFYPHDQSSINEIAIIALHSNITRDIQKTLNANSARTWRLLIKAWECYFGAATDLPAISQVVAMYAAEYLNIVE